MWLPGLLLLLLGLVFRSQAAEESLAAFLIQLSLGKFKNVRLNETVPAEAVLGNIASNVTVIIFQIHTFHQNVTISFDKNPSTNNSGTGVDKGLVSVLRPEQTVCTWYLKTGDANHVLSTVVAYSYAEKDPIPGGCNLEFNLDIDPNIYLEYNMAETHIKFAPANLGYTRGTNPPLCDSGSSQDSRLRLYYDIYQYFLPENDLSEETFVSHMRKMSNVKHIRTNGIKIMTLTSQDKTDLYFSSLPGQGVIYNVIVRDPHWNTSAAYVPVHTYACSLSASTDNCFTSRKLATKIFFTALAVLGLFICFVGHRFWKTGLFFMGFIILAFFFFITITRIPTLNYDGDYRVFQDDAVFWVTFCCIALMVPIVFVGCPRVLNILTCGIIGSYTIILATACYIYTSLSYIVIDLLRRILHDDFKRAYTSVPFQSNDLILLAVWVLLAVGGITIQLRRERREAPFPPHPYRIWKRERERRVTNILDPSHHVPPLRERLHNKLSQIKDFFRKEQPAGERTPLLL
ncbi:transmembrane 7 superfamily member 3 isoform X2 [Pogona vitticeps]